MARPVRKQSGLDFWFVSSAAKPMQNCANSNRMPLGTFITGGLPSIILDTVGVHLLPRFLAYSLDGMLARRYSIHRSASEFLSGRHIIERRYGNPRELHVTILTPPEKLL